MRSFMSFNLISLVLSQKIFGQISSNGLVCKHFQQELCYVQISSLLCLFIREGELPQSVKCLQKISLEISLP